jgi:hypothetical protein
MQGYRSLGYHLLHYYKRNLQDSHFMGQLNTNRIKKPCFSAFRRMIFHEKALCNEQATCWLH